MTSRQHTTTHSPTLFGSSVIIANQRERLFLCRKQVRFRVRVGVRVRVRVRVRVGVSVSVSVKASCFVLVCLVMSCDSIIQNKTREHDERQKTKENDKGER
jgi:hypothetical protein